MVKAISAVETITNVMERGACNAGGARVESCWSEKSGRSRRNSRYPPLSFIQDGVLS